MKEDVKKYYEKIQIAVIKNLNKKDYAKKFTWKRLFSGEIFVRIGEGTGFLIPDEQFVLDTNKFSPRWPEMTDQELQLIIKPENYTRVNFRETFFLLDGCEMAFLWDKTRRLKVVLYYDAIKQFLTKDFTFYACSTANFVHVLRDGQLFAVIGAPDEEEYINDVF